MSHIDLIPPGTILPFGGVTAPGGYALCDGTSYLRADQTSLFEAIGTVWGTADGTHFNAPDLRGRFLRGHDNGAAVDPDAAGRTASAAGGATGDNVGTVQDEEQKEHTHVQNQHRHAVEVPYGPGSFATKLYASGDANAGSLATNSSYVTPTNQNTGGNETRPVNAGVNYIIKL